MQIIQRIVFLSNDFRDTISLLMDGNKSLSKENLIENLKDFYYMQKEYNPNISTDYVLGAIVKQVPDLISASPKSHEKVKKDQKATHCTHINHLHFHVKR